jgi:hypothetical protein
MCPFRSRCLSSTQKGGSEFDSAYSYHFTLLRNSRKSSPIPLPMPQPFRLIICSKIHRFKRNLVRFQNMFQSCSSSDDGRRSRGKGGEKENSIRLVAVEGDGIEGRGSFSGSVVRFFGFRDLSRHGYYWTSTSLLSSMRACGGVE